VTQTPEERAQYAREWYLRNRERILAQRREYYERNRKAVKERRMAYYAEHRDEILEYHREYDVRNRAKITQYQRDYKNRNRERLRAASLADRHGVLAVEAWAQLWEKQNGQCYLCGDSMDRLQSNQVHIDHDHRCCPHGKSCPACRRGLACSDCNAAIGYADDDPARLRRIADALETARLAVDRRMADASKQLQFPSEETR